MKLPRPFERPQSTQGDSDGEKRVPASTEELADVMRQARDTWLRYLDFIEAHSHTRWVFRGCGSVDHKCMPGVGRTKTYNELDEVRLFQAFKRSANLLVDAQPADDWEWLAIAQHYGLPTRLLDWTTNPLVACFFAVSSGKAEDDAVVYAYSIKDQEIIDPKDTPSPFSITSVGFLLPTRNAARLVSQRGLFTAHNAPNVPWEPSSLTKDRFVIPALLRARFQRRLFRLGIDGSHVWADLSGLCATLKWRFEARIGIGSAMIG